MKIVFLDRDGVINEFPGKDLYVTTLEGFRPMPAALKGIRALTEAGYELHVASNQGCISRKLITWELLDRITKKMLDAVSAAGGKLDGVHYCPHQSADQCECKKPKTGLLVKALAGRKADLKRTYFVGDSEEDMKAADSFGCKKILVLSGRLKENDLPGISVKPDHVCRDLYEASQWILKNES